MSDTFAKIDALSKWSKGTNPTLPKEFIIELQAILTDLAYHAATTDETAAENWHDDISDKLTKEFNTESKTNKKASGKKDDIPPSLRSILNGTHQSFKS